MRFKSRIIAAVEIGTSKVAVLVGHHSGEALDIIGFGECQSRGVFKGVVTNYKAASDCVHSAFETAEQTAGERIDHVFLAQTGGHLEGFYNEASVSVQSADNMVSAQDIETVCELATAKKLPDGRMVVHNIRRPFRVDGRLVPGDPEHLVGTRLDVGYWTVHGQESRLADNIHVIRGYNLEVRELIASSLASGYVVTTAEERQNGVLAIDIGAGTTDFALYRDGSAHTTGVVAVGGTHLTNDLALALRLTEGKAEKLKLRHGRATTQARTRTDKVWLDGNFAIGDRQFPLQSIELVTATRMRELFEVVRKKLGNAFAPETCPAGVALTGGAAKIPGAAECAAHVFGVPTHLGEMPSWVREDSLRDPGYATAIGLLHYGVSSHGAGAPVSRKRRGFLQSLFASA